jgi:UDP-N-acetylmuramoyl-tripeptide--D-alanyl-D-alanine ligase
MWPLNVEEVLHAMKMPVGAFPELLPELLTGAATDSRKVRPGDLFIAIRGEKFDGHAFVEECLRQGARLALVEMEWQGFKSLSTDLQKRCIRVPDVLLAYRKLASFFRSRFTFPVIGIGGSNGKTTTKEMLAALLQGPLSRVSKTEKSENGFLGMAVTMCARSHHLETTPHALVLEIGIDETGAMEQHVQLGRPDAVLLTALGPEHLAGLGTWENAVEEEYKLFSLSHSACRIWQLAEPQLAKKGHEVRRGDILVSEKSAPLPGSTEQIAKLTYSIKGADAYASQVEIHWIPSASDLNSQPWKAEFTVPLPGKHNVENFALAMAGAAWAGRTLREIKQGWQTFVPPAMRSRVSKLIHNTVLYDDCYNASPASMQAALETVMAGEWQARRKIVVLGDMLDLGAESKMWHLELTETLKQLRNTRLCLYGDAMLDVYNTLRDQTKFLPAHQFEVHYLPKESDPRTFVTSSQASLAGSVILVKGSRGMDLGRVVTSVLNEFPENNKADS